MPKIDAEWVCPIQWGDPLPEGKEGMRVNVSAIPIDGGRCASLLFTGGQWIYPTDEAKCYSLPGTPRCPLLEQHRDAVASKVNEWLVKEAQALAFEKEAAEQ